MDSLFVNLIGSIGSPFIKIIRDHKGNGKLHKEILSWLDILEGKSDKKICIDNRVRNLISAECKKLQVMTDNACHSKFMGTTTGTLEPIIDVIFTLYGIKYEYEEKREKYKSLVEVENDILNNIIYNENKKKFVYINDENMFFFDVDESLKRNAKSQVQKKKFSDDIKLELYKKIYNTENKDEQILQAKIITIKNISNKDFIYSKVKINASMSYISYFPSIIVTYNNLLNEYNKENNINLKQFMEEQIDIKNINNINFLVINRSRGMGLTYGIIPMELNISGNNFRFKGCSLFENRHFTSVISDYSNNYYYIDIVPGGQNIIKKFPTNDEQTLNYSNIKGSVNIWKNAKFVFYHRS